MHWQSQWHTLNALAEPVAHLKYTGRTSGTLLQRAAMEKLAVAVRQQSQVPCGCIFGNESQSMFSSTLSDVSKVSRPPLM